MNKIFLILIPITLVAACKKDTPAAKKFNLTYQVINQGDPDVDTIMTATKTVYSGQLKINWDYALFNDITPHDSIILSSPPQVYAGCQASLSVSLRYKTPRWSQLYADSLRSGESGLAIGWTRTRAWQLPTVTLASPADSSIIFRYPSDTLRAKEVYKLPN